MFFFRACEKSIRKPHRDHPQSFLQSMSSPKRRLTEVIEMVLGKMVSCSLCESLLCERHSALKNKRKYASPSIKELHSRFF